jgi:hypothetical protein
MRSDGFYKHNEQDAIWWKKSDAIGEWLFSFDCNKVYNMFRDYPHNMTKEEVRIFDRENPFWADYFKDRKNGKS